MDNLENGIAAYKAGRHDEAREFFIAALKADQKSERAWGWLYMVARSDAEKIECMQRALAINPNNAKAREILSKLTADDPFEAAAQKPVTVRTGAPEKSSSSTRYVLAGAISLVVVFCCLFALVNTEMPASPSTLGQLPASQNNVRYVVSGTARTATITYMNNTGGMEQRAQGLPFQMDMVVGAGAALSLVAQMDGSGSITCEILVNGAKVKSATSTADYGLVNCSDWTIR